MKITLEQFYEFPRYTAAIHCSTEEQAEKLTRAFDAMGKCWNGGSSYIGETNWEVYQENTMYLNSNQFGDVRYKDEEDPKLVVYEFEDVIFNTDQFKVFLLELLGGGKS